MQPDISVEQVRPEITLPLRRRVLRPHQSLEELAAQDAPGATHFAAFMGGRVAATAVVQPEGSPWAPRSNGSWRIRGMATDPRDRGSGVGGTLLAAVLRFCAEQRMQAAWCAARIPALGFYERAGFLERGERWDDPLTGPHVHVELHPLAVRTHRLQAAVAGRDLQGLERLLHEDFVLTTGRAGAEERDRREYLQITGSRYEISTYAFEELHAAAYGDAGVVRSRYHQEGSMDGADRTQAFRMTDVWVGAPPRLVTRHAQPLTPGSR